MTFRKSQVVTLGGLSAVAIAAITIVACYDGPTPPVTETLGLASTSRASRAPNRLAWVGDSHNAALSAVMHPRRGRALRGNICTRILVATMETDALAPVRDKGVPFARSAALLGLQKSGCLAFREQMIAMRHAKGKGFRPALYVPNAGQGMLTFVASFQEETPPPLPADVQALVDEVIAATNDADTPAIFNARIAAVEQAAGALPDTLHQAIVLASAAVATSSAEYWRANYEAVIRNYAIAAATAGDGEPGDDECEPNVDGEIDPLACMGDGIDVSAAEQTYRMHLAMMKPQRTDQCGGEDCCSTDYCRDLIVTTKAEAECYARNRAEGWRGTLRNDAIGAVGGAILGALGGKSWQTTAVGALGAGALASAGTAIVDTTIWAYCQATNE